MSPLSQTAGRVFPGAVRILMPIAWRLILALCFLAPPVTSVVRQDAPAAGPVRVMSFNLWHGGDAGRQPLRQSVEVIKAARADLIGLQETAGLANSGPRPDRAIQLAQALGFHYFDQGGRCGILSRHPIVAHTPKRHGAKVELPSGEAVWIFNVHFAHAPYQPYQLLRIPYEGGPFLETSEQAIDAARRARGHQVQALLEEMRAPLQSGSPVFLTGDLNEPSHQDWTEAAAQAGLCPLPVAWPATQAIVDAGLTDSFRSAHPSELRARGLTWTPITTESDSKDRHDRIDFVFFAGRGVKLIESEVVGEKPERAGIVVLPYPSDHRAVVSAFELTR
jgi:exodeoxyribonuclease III